MSNSNMSNIRKQQSSICPANGRQTVGDGAFSTDISPRVVAVCHMQGNNDLYYYSTTFSGGPQACFPLVHSFDHTSCPFFSSGAFDVPTSKCPPDRGSSEWVTDTRAPVYPSPSSDSSSLPSSLEQEYFRKPLVYPSTPPPELVQSSFDTFDQFRLPSPAVAAAPQAIKPKNGQHTGLATPPMTPEESREGQGSVSAISAKQSKSTLDFLTTLFPRSGLSALPHAKGVSVSAPTLGTVFDGVVLELPGKPRTLYVDGKNSANVNLRESVVALLDLADERLECTALVIALEKSSPGLGDLLHSLMYVGATVVTKPPFPVDPAYVLVGLEI